jgi:hypothetical protein
MVFAREPLAAAEETLMPPSVTVSLQLALTPVVVFAIGIKDALSVSVYGLKRSSAAKYMG